MSNYIGVRCPVCNKKFIETDDIVVCPTCGAPHHRACYAKENQCAFAADHLSGKVWSDPAGQVPPEQEQQEAVTKICGRCGAANPPDSIFCQVCGHPVSLHREGDQGAPGQQEWNFPGMNIKVDTISMVYGGLSPEEEIEGETARDIARYVGSGSAYYLPRFRLLSSNIRAVTANISAMFLGFVYYFYRKMYLVGAFLLAVYLISSIPAYLYSWEILPEYMRIMGLESNGVYNEAAANHYYWLTNLTRFLAFIISLITSLFANRYYFNRTIQAVREVRLANTEDGVVARDYSQELAAAGGGSKVAVIAVLAGSFLLRLAVSIVMVGYQLAL